MISRLVDLCSILANLPDSHHTPAAAIYDSQALTLAMSKDPYNDVKRCV